MDHRRPSRPALALAVAAVMVLAGCAPTAAPSPRPSAPPFAGQATAPASGWPMYHRDPSHTGFDPSPVSLDHPGRRWQSPTLDGDVYAEPLIGGGRVFVATQNDTVYALGEQNGQILWRTHLGEPVPRSQLPCGNIDLTGITGTPVIDQASGTLLALAFLQPGRHELFAIDLRAGGVRWHRPADPPGVDPLVHQQRAALALGTGRIYIAYGGLFGDCGAYRGWVVALPLAGNGPMRSFKVPAGQRAGIWAPSGPSVDAAGDLYVATGNSTASSSFDFGNAVIRLSPDLTILDWFAPANWAALNSSDTDLGSIGPAILQNGLVFQAGKDGIGYLLQAGHLGGIGKAAFQAPIGSAAFGGTAYRSPLLYVACANGLVSLRIDDRPGFSVAWRSPGYFAGPPIVAGGLVWTVDTQRAVLHAYDPQTGAERLSAALGRVMHFTTPAADAGRVVVAAARTIIAFG